MLNSKGFTTGTVGNNDGGHVKSSQVRAAKSDDLGAQQVAKELGGLPVVADALDPAGIGPGGAGQRLHRSGLRAFGGGSVTPARASNPGSSADANAPPPSPILTAGSDKPECIN